LPCRCKLLLTRYLPPSTFHLISSISIFHPPASTSIHLLYIILTMFYLLSSICPLTHRVCSPSASTNLAGSTKPNPPYPTPDLCQQSTAPRHLQDESTHQHPRLLVRSSSPPATSASASVPVRLLLSANPFSACPPIHMERLLAMHTARHAHMRFGPAEARARAYPLWGPFREPGLGCELCVSCCLSPPVCPGLPALGLWAVCLLLGGSMCGWLRVCLTWMTAGVVAALHTQHRETHKVSHAAPSR
jgi:hypothetical protein